MSQFDGAGGLQECLSASTEPWSIWAKVREDSPVYWCKESRCFYLSRYRDVDDALRSPFLTVEHPFRASRQLFGPTAIDQDGADHSASRKLLAWFGRRQMELWQRQAVAPAVDALLAELEPGHPVDFASLAWRLPTSVIARVLGCPQEDIGWLWQTLRPVVAYIQSPRASVSEAVFARDSLNTYLREILASGPPEDSVLGTLTQPEYALLEQEIVRCGLLLLAAGTETTAAAVLNLIACFIQHQDTTDSLRAGEYTSSDVVRESLRYIPPLHLTVRFATQDLQFCGIDVPAGSPVQLSLAAANRDPAVFDGPDSWRPGRRGQALLSFGAGVHACAGALLAQSELQTLLDALLIRFQRILPAGPLGPSTGIVFYYPRSVPILFK